MLGGSIVSFLLVGGIGGWAATTKISGAVLAPGTVVVEGNVKKVQHLTGGIVGEIFVKDGSRVMAGDLLVRLDETLTRANLLVITRQLDEYAGRAARLKSERDGLDKLKLPADLEARAGDPQVAEIIAGEQQLLLSRKKTRDGQKAQLRERIIQLNEEIDGITSQTKAKDLEIELIGNELKGLSSLEEQRLVTTNKMTVLRREAARLEGEYSSLRAAAAQAKGRIAEIELHILQLDQELRTEVVKELREIQAKEAEFTERRVAAQDQLKRVEIRAPLAGIVHQLGVHTVGGVINPAEPIMLIVPESDRLVIEAKVAPHDIDQVRAAKTALIRFSAFNHNTTPEIEGRIANIAPNHTVEQQTGATYFLTRIELAEDELRRLGDVTLVPGMPADVQIKTGDRTALSFLLKPIEDQIANTFKGR